MNTNFLVYSLSGRKEWITDKFWMLIVKRKTLKGTSTGPAIDPITRSVYDSRKKYQ